MVSHSSNSLSADVLAGIINIEYGVRVMSEVKRWKHTIIHQNSDEVESSMVTSITGWYVRYEDYAALQQKLDAVTAEAERMRKAIKQIFPDGLGDGNGGVGFSNAAKECYASATETPATDAILNALRAEGATEVARRIRICAEEFHNHHCDVVEECACIADEYAAQLRNGEHVAKDGE